MCVNIELDVGLYCGGVVDQVVLGELLVLIVVYLQYLEFVGFMGYDFFVGMGVLGIFGLFEELFVKVMVFYQGYVDFVCQCFVVLWILQLILNIVGSFSYCMYEKEMLSSEVLVGIVMFKLSYYDLVFLVEYVLVVYIVMLVFKSIGVVQILVLDGKFWLFFWWDFNQCGIFFIYGGNWMVDFVLFEGLCSNGIYGCSLNQEMVNGLFLVGLEVDDQVFLWLIQSELVLL